MSSLCSSMYSLNEVTSADAFSRASAECPAKSTSSLDTSSIVCS